MNVFHVTSRPYFETMLDDIANVHLKTQPHVTGVVIVADVNRYGKATISWRYRGTNCALVMHLPKNLTDPQDALKNTHVFLTVLLGGTYNNNFYSVVDPKGVIQGGETLQIVHAFNTMDLQDNVWEIFFSCGVAAIENQRGQLTKCSNCPNQLACLSEREE